MLKGPRTEDGGVAAVCDARNSVDAREHCLDVVLVQVDGIPVAEEVITLPRCGRPVGVRAPARTWLCWVSKRHTLSVEYA